MTTTAFVSAIAADRGATPVYLKLFSGQFLVPVILLDETGVHKYQQLMLPENLIVRTNTREIGLFKIDHAWETRTDVQRPEPVEIAPAREGAT